VFIIKETPVGEAVYTARGTLTHLMGNYIYCYSQFGYYTRFETTPS